MLQSLFESSYLIVLDFNFQLVLFDELFVFLYVWLLILTGIDLFLNHVKSIFEILYDLIFSSQVLFHYADLLIELINLFSILLLLNPEIVICTFKFLDSLGVFVIFSN